MSRRRHLLLVLPVALAAGCGEGPDERPDAASPAEQRYAVSAMVLESPDHGPQLCASVAETNPPQCGGPDVVGWDWAAVDGDQSTDGTTWGDYRVVGTWDGDALTLTEPPGPARYGDGEEPPEQDLSTPCPTPEGGWAVVDPATATRAGRDAASDYAWDQPDLGSIWLDDGAELAERLPAGLEQAVLGVSFTGDLATHERELRAVYGGPLCVTRAERSLAELEALQQVVHQALRGDALTSSAGDRGHVVAMVPLVDQELLDRVAEVDPDGLVELRSWLQPVG